MKWAWFTFSAVLLVGCASPVPQPIREAPSGAPSAQAVRGNPQDFAGAKVRWGGTIAAVENREGETVIEVVSRELESNGRPKETDRSGGRFLARHSGFLDPMIYTKGRLLTVAGTVAGEERRPIGKFTYSFPVVNVESLYLWEPRAEMRYDAYPYDPFWYDPWWPRFYSPWRRYPFF